MIFFSNNHSIFLFQKISKQEMTNIFFVISKLFFMMIFYIFKKNFKNSFFRIGKKVVSKKDKAQQ